MDIVDILAKCDAYCARKGIASATLSTRLFGSGSTIKRLKDGKQITLRVLSRAYTRLDQLERDGSHTEHTEAGRAAA